MEGHAKTYTIPSSTQPYAKRGIVFYFNSLPEKDLNSVRPECKPASKAPDSDRHPDHFFHRGGCEFAVHAADEGGGDAGGADGFAGVVV